MEILFLPVAYIASVLRFKLRGAEFPEGPEAATLFHSVTKSFDVGEGAGATGLCPLPPEASFHALRVSRRLRRDC